MNIQIDHRIEEAKQLSLDELKAITEHLLEEIEEREWDRVLQSPEGLADNEQEYQKTIKAIKSGNIQTIFQEKALQNYFKA